MAAANGDGARRTYQETTIEWAAKSVNDLLLKKSPWLYKDDESFLQYERILKNNVTEFREDPRTPFTCPRGEMDISGAMSSQLIVPVWDVARSFISGLSAHLRPSNVKLRMQLLKEPYASHKRTVNGKQVSELARANQVLMLTPFEIVGKKIKQWDNIQRFDYLDRGKQWAGVEDYAFSSTAVIIEVKDCGRIHTKGFEQFAKRRMAIGVNYGWDENQSILAVTQAQLQQGTRYCSKFKCGQLCLTDYKSAAVFRIPPGLRLDPVVEDNQKADIADTTASSMGRRPDTLQMTNVVSAQNGPREIEWAIVKPKDLHKAVGYLAYIACEETKAAHGLAPGQAQVATVAPHTAAAGPIGDLTKRTAAADLDDKKPKRGEPVSHQRHHAEVAVKEKELKTKRTNDVTERAARAKGRE